MTYEWHKTTLYKLERQIGMKTVGIGQPLPFLYFYSGTETETGKLGRENEIGYSG